MKLNPTKLPDPLIPLISMAERWGIRDDVEREEAVSKANCQELEDLVNYINDISDDALFGWLSGIESFNPNPSREYIAITCLTMAIDSAKLKLKKL
jgi:hypothetical protein